MSFWSKLKKGFKKIGNGLKTAVNWVGDKVKKGVGWVYNTGKKIVNGALDFAGCVVGKVGNVAHKVLDIGRDAIDTVGGALGHVGQFASNLAPIVGAVAPVVGGAVTGGLGLVGSLASRGMSALGSFGGVAGSMLGGLTNMFRGGNPATDYTMQQQMNEALMQQQMMTGTQPPVQQVPPVTPLDEVTNPGLMSRVWSGAKWLGAGAWGLAQAHPYIAGATALAGAGAYAYHKGWIDPANWWNKAKGWAGFGSQPEQEVSQGVLGSQPVNFQ